MLSGNAVDGQNSVQIQQQTNAIREHLFRHEDDLVYVFVDPLIFDPYEKLTEQLQKEEATKHTVTLLNRGIGKDKCPYFLQIPNASSALLDISYELALDEVANKVDRRTVCAWFTSKQKPVSICASLKNSMERQTPTLQRWLFRFFDPRVSAHAARIFPTGFFLPGIQNWWFLDDTKSLQKLIDQQYSDVENALLPSKPQKISSAQFTDITHIGLINQAYALWHGMHTLPINAVPLLSAAVHKVSAIGVSLDDEADCIAFMLHRCIVHSHIELHPTVQEWLAQTIDKTGSYASSAAAADEGIWADIAAGNWLDLAQKTNR